MVQILELTAVTAGFIGKALIAFTAVMVHYRFRHEHKVDEDVFAEMKREQVYAGLGVFLIMVQWIIEVALIKGYIT